MHSASRWRVAYRSSTPRQARRLAQILVLICGPKHAAMWPRRLLGHIAACLGPQIKTSICASRLACLGVEDLYATRHLDAECIGELVVVDAVRTAQPFAGNRIQPT